MTSERRLPLQGGLPPVESLGDGVVEIACDESGFSGTNLLDPATPVFTHASVDLTIEEAAELVSELRAGFRWSVDEYKSGQLRRGPRADEASAWLLSALRGRAHVHVIDKELFLVTRLVDLLLAEPSYAAGTRLTQEHRPAALDLYRAGRLAGPAWRDFLAAFVDLVRTKRRHWSDRTVVDRFFLCREALRSLVPDAEAVVVLDRVSRARVTKLLGRLADDDRSVPPPLEPLLPALAETVLFWSSDGRRVLAIHDEQSALTADRLRRLQTVLAEAAHWSACRPRGHSPLVGLVMVDSRDDPRVQVADILAGVVRRSPGLDGDRLLQPLLSSSSLRDPES